MNLHAIANTAISAIHPNESVTLYQASGQENMRGLVTTKYLAPQEVVAQVQSEGNASLQHMGKTGQSAVQKRFYIHANTSLVPQGLVRQKDRSGDIIERADGTFWLVTSVPNDCSANGWICLVASLQSMAPDFTGQDWFTGTLSPNAGNTNDNFNYPTL